MAHTLLFTMGYNAPEDRILPENYDWKDRRGLDEALRTVTKALRPWTIDFHIAQNDATVFGSGTHDKTGRHCLPTDPKGKLDVVEHAGLWMRDERGQVTKAFDHVCWDGCMFPNATMMQTRTWNEVLRLLIDVRSAHGWDAPVPTAELAILERQLKVKREFGHTWAGSSKRIKLSGTFMVKAGFDLRQDVAVDVRPDEIVIELPHAQIVGVEEKHVDVLALENGLWNRVSGADLENELAQLPEMARRQALELDLPAEAEEELQQQLNKRIHARQPVRLVFTTPSLIESPVANP